MRNARIATERFIAERLQKCQKTKQKKIEKITSIPRIIHPISSIGVVCGSLPLHATNHLCAPTFSVAAEWLTYSKKKIEGSTFKLGVPAVIHAIAESNEIVHTLRVL